MTDKEIPTCLFHRATIPTGGGGPTPASDSDWQHLIEAVVMLSHSRRNSSKTPGLAVFAAVLLGLTLAGFGVAGTTVRADETLHAAIDRLILAKAPDGGNTVATAAGDDEFLRRITLDLTGMIPTATQTRVFLDDSDPDKRAKLIDRLLASPEYARHMQRVFDVVLMRRLGGSNVPAAQWTTFLRTSFAENKPWDQLTREIVSNDGADAKNRGPAKFFLDRNGDVNGLTRDIGRIFLGANLECAQCHDHPEVDDWKQEHYYGISAFLVRSFVFTDPKKKVKVFAEKAEGEVKFESVFEVRDKTSKGPKSTAPKLFDGMLVVEAKFEKGQAT